MVWNLQADWGWESKDRSDAIIDFRIISEQLAIETYFFVRICFR